MDEGQKRAIKDAARDHLLLLLFMMQCTSSGYTGAEAEQLRSGLIEKLRRETFPTDDPAQSMLAADEVADAFADLLELDEQSLALLDRLAAARKR